MKRYKILLIIILVSVAFFVVRSYKNMPLVGPVLKQNIAQNQIVTPLPTPANNIPKEIKYNDSTDLMLELNSVNPQVLDSDFESI